MTKTAVLLMAYGTPATSRDIESYYTHIRHGHAPPRELLAELTERYEAIGGVSPLLEISRRQASGLQQELDMPVVLGMKHAAPFIENAVDELVASGVDKIVGLVLAPHYSTMSIGQYEDRVRARLAGHADAPTFSMVRNWHQAPGYLSFLARRIEDAAREMSRNALAQTHVVFSAHSLPERIVADGDPYPDQLAETARSIAVLNGLASWSTGWQSAGRTDAAWLGPDILDVLRELAEGGVRAVIVCPCGFVADHLEVLYDLDIEAAAVARELGIEFARTASPNDDPMFIQALADVVVQELASTDHECGCDDECRVTAPVPSTSRGGI